MSGGRQAGIHQVMVRSKKNREGDGWKGMGLFYMGDVQEGLYVGGKEGTNPWLSG